jgi:transcription antitermination factor NusG
MNGGKKYMSNTEWWVLRVTPNEEIRAEKQVKQLGYEAICPYQLGYRRRRGNPRPWKHPLFRGYLFATWPDWNAGWNHVTSKIEAIYDFLGPAMSPMPSILKPADVEYLMSIADGKYDPDAEKEPALCVGETVLIAEGIGQGYGGEVEEIRGKKAAVSVKEVKMTSKLWVPIANLQKT